jgi:CRP-like cAMP-binding protein
VRTQFKYFIKQISSLSDQMMETLLEAFHLKNFKKNDFFAREGEYAKQIGFLYEGIVRAYFIDDEGKEYNKQFFVAPSIIGAYSSLLSKKPNRIAQQALTNCQVLVADYSKIELLYDQFHELERLGRKIAEHYFSAKEKKEIEMALLDATQRYLILREEFPQIETIISQRNVASYLSISQTQLSRIRKTMSSL